MPRQVSKSRQALIAAVRDVLREERTVDLLGDDRKVDRRIERWRGDGLGPLLDRSPAEDAPHYVALAELGGVGTVADTTALRLARRGFACRRYGQVLWRAWGLDRAASSPTDPHQAGEDVSLALGEALVASLDQPSTGPLDRMFRGALGQARRKPAEGGFLEAALGDVAALAMGGAPIEVTSPAGESWPSMPPDVRPWELPPGPSPLAQVAAVVEHDLPEVVANVPVAEAALAALGTSLRGDDLGDMAALHAPMQVLWSRRYRYAAQAWEATGGAWHVAPHQSTPQFAMAALQCRPRDDQDRGPAEAGALVIEANIGTRPGDSDERLVLRRPPLPSP